MRKLLRVTLIAALAAIVLFAAAALAAGTGDPIPGGEGDPLVTLSYLEQVYQDYITGLLRKDLEEKTDTLRADLEERISALEEAGKEADLLKGATFHLVELRDGQVLTGQRGVELLLRVGEASVKAQSSPGLVDTTTAGSLENGAALEKNHLYMITIPDNGITAKGSVLLLARGEYSVS